MIKIFGKTDAGLFYNNLFLNYKKQIVDMHFKSWKQEDIRGRDVNMEDVAYWYMAFLLIMLVKSDIDKGITTADIYNKYNLDTLIKCFHCKKIPLKELLPVKQDGEGVESIAVENNFIVECKQCYHTSSVNLITLNGNSAFKALLNEDTCCKLLI